jgi:hypothetical protein
MVESELSPSAGAFEEAQRTPYTLRRGEPRCACGADHGTTIEKRPTRYVPGAFGCGRPVPARPAGLRLGS